LDLSVEGALVVDVLVSGLILGLLAVLLFGNRKVLIRLAIIVGTAVGMVILGVSIAAVNEAMRPRREAAELVAACGHVANRDNLSDYEVRLLNTRCKSAGYAEPCTYIPPPPPLSDEELAKLPGDKEADYWMKIFGTWKCS
jgi:hypothetical protein